MWTNLGVARELLSFLWQRKLWWLIPMVSLLLVLRPAADLRLQFGPGTVDLHVVLSTSKLISMEPMEFVDQDIA